MPIAIATIDAALVILGVFLAYRLSFNNLNYKQLPLPPSPSGALPLLGHLLKIPTRREWEQYHRWCKELDTDILYLNAAGTSVIVLDTREATLELFERRSSLYSGRAPMPMVTDPMLMGWDFDVAFMAYGDRWRAHRKLMHQAFHPAAAAEYKPIQLRVARDLLPKFKNTEDILEDIRHWAGDTIISMSYGLSVKPRDDPYIRMAEEGVSPILPAARPGAFLVDKLPFLKYVPEWMPGAGFKRKARRWRFLSQQMLNKPYEDLKQAMLNGPVKPSFTSRALQKMAEGRGAPYEEQNIKEVAGSLFQAGSETTVAGLSLCILSLMDHPEVLKKAQEEIDSVTDSKRLPNFDDQDLLPYCTAVMKEAFRFWGVGPMGLPHLLNADDEYNGYRLPKGSVVVANIWAMLHNEKLYPDPFTFNADRFLDKDPILDNHYNSVFGFGRRICPARFMVPSSIWIALVTMMAVYDISKATDEEGRTIEPSHEFPPSLLLMPLPFQCSFTVRSKTTEKLLETCGEIE